ncbi:MAG TPA: OpgC domain-containing protein, partial [Hyphomicrobium sp.]
MPMSAAGPGLQRDLRIDFFRGLALLFIFIDHVPGNELAKVTLRNFGFSDAAEVFVMLAGFSAVLAYGRTFDGQGFKAGTARVLDRVRDLYAWHLGLVIVCTVGLTLAAAVFANPMYMKSIGVHVFTETPARSAVMAAALVNQPNMLNILPLYIVLLLFWLPFVLWLLPRRPWLTLCFSVGVWALANVLELNLPSQ